MVLGQSLLPLALPGNQSLQCGRRSRPLATRPCSVRGPTQVEDFPARDLPEPTCDMTVPTDEKSLL